MPPLRIRCYTDPDDNDVVGGWYGEQEATIQADLLGIIDQLEGSARARTNADIFKELEQHSSSKSCVGFHEIRIIKDGRHCRVIGVLYDDVFILLTGFCKDDGNKYKQQCDRALERKAEFDRGRGRSRECDFPAPDQN